MAAQNATQPHSAANHADALSAQMQLFSWCALILWLILAVTLYNQHLKWKRRRREDDVFLELETATNPGEVQYLVSFFTGRGYRHAPSGNVRLHLIGSLYPGKIHTLSKEHVTAPETEDTDEDEDEDDEEEEDLARNTSYGSGGALNRSRSRRTIRKSLPQKSTKSKPAVKEATGTFAHAHQRRSTQHTHPKPKHLFPPNCHEKFLITEDVCLGRITMIVLQTEVEGKHPYWDCESVIVRDVTTNEAWYFRAGARVGFPPVILDPATIEELTTFGRSWHRRVRREVRHGQYVFFGFWFKPKSSVYSFAQRVTVAVIGYLNLFCNCVLYLGLAFPPSEEDHPIFRTSVNTKIAFVRPEDLDYWVGHVAVVGVVAALTTTIIGYMLVTLFREKAKYETRVHEMDYVIGTALQEYNEMKKEQAKIRERTGRERKRRKQAGKRRASSSGPSSGDPQPDPGSAASTLQRSQSAPNLDQTGSEFPPDNTSLFGSMYNKITSLNPFSKKSEQDLEKSAAPPGNTEAMFNRSRSGSFQGLAPTSTASVTPSRPHPSPSVPTILVTHVNEIRTSERTPLLPLPSNVSIQQQHSRKPLLVVHPQPRRESRTRRSESPSRISTLTRDSQQLSPAEQRELMRTLFEQDEDAVDEATLAAGGESGGMAADNGSSIEFGLEGSSISVTSGKIDPKLARAMPRKSGAGTANADQGDHDHGQLEYHQEIQAYTRKFPHPILGWLAVIVTLVVPAAVLFVWIGPIVGNLSDAGRLRALNMILSTFAAALLLEVLGMETIKMALLGAWYAFTDKTMYKRILRSSTRKRKVKGGKSMKGRARRKSREARNSRFSSPKQ